VVSLFLPAAFPGTADALEIVNGLTSAGVHRPTCKDYESRRGMPCAPLDVSG
jgi:hypothetical protein